MTKRYICVNCGEPDAFIILTDEVWTSVSVHKRDFLCLQCIEKELGREITSSDLKNVPINYTNITILKRFEELKWEKGFSITHQMVWNYKAKKWILSL